MTAIKEQFMQMLPQGLSEVPDDEAQYMIPDNINAYDDEIAELFGV